jgi:hypothetical protein
MLVGDNEWTTMKNAGESLAISIAMQMLRRYDVGWGASPNRAHPGLQ